MCEAVRSVCLLLDIWSCITGWRNGRRKNGCCWPTPTCDPYTAVLVPTETEIILDRLKSSCHKKSDLLRTYYNLKNLTFFPKWYFFPVITAVNCTIVSGSELLRIIINVIILNSKLHKDENHICMQRIINPHETISDQSWSAASVTVTE